MNGNNASKTSHRMTVSERQVSSFGVAFTLAVCSITAIACGVIQYGGQGKPFWTIMLPAGLALLAALAYAIRGFVCRRWEAAHPLSDERLRRSDRLCEQLLAILGINLWGCLFIVAMMFQIRPLQYVAWALAAIILIGVLFAEVTDRRSRKQA
ncbi:hypothetical protein [Bifidobacterium miconisargentati]|uniref:hypothetical protein n=1 Tax=Bifidobacterium miconisargentati TaxID=2834437 RepID=UPI001BDC54DA|nr:hypothetical protein [Bifidobacterium miconisargentati]MBW3090212.1 hypothetical protein [Bifidobacterium miconisargentati]